MTETLIEFRWYRWSKGYKLRAARLEPGVPGVLPSLLSGPHEVGPKVVPIGGAKFANQPMSIPDLCKTFAEVENPEQLVKFINKWGALTSDGQNRSSGEDVEFALEHSRAMRDFISLQQDDPKALRGRAGREYSFGSLDFVIAFDPAGGSRLRLRPNNLLTALWYQLASLLEDSRVGSCALRKCHNCGEIFKAGVGKCRADAKFCKDACRIQFNSANRSKGRKRVTA